MDLLTLGALCSKCKCDRESCEMGCLTADESLTGHLYVANDAMYLWFSSYVLLF